MIWRYILFSLLCASILITTSVLRHRAQQPLLPPHGSSQSHLHNIKVVLALEERGSEMEQLAEIPLNTRIFSGASFTSRPKTIRIVMAFAAQDRSVPLERLDSIMCKITTEIDTGEQNATVSENESEGLSWFMLKDGSLRLQDTASKWFLGGRAIESLECR